MYGAKGRRREQELEVVEPEFTADKINVDAMPLHLKKKVKFSSGNYINLVGLRHMLNTDKREIDRDVN